MRSRHPLAPRASAFALALVCAAPQLACAPSLPKLQTASRVARAALAEAPALVSDLAAGNFLDQSEAEQARKYLAGLADLYAPFDDLFQQITAVKTAEQRQALVEKFNPFIAELERLNSEKLLFVKNAAANAWLAGILSQARLVARLVSGLLKLKASDVLAARKAEADVPRIEAACDELYRLATTELQPHELRAQVSAE